MSNVPVPRGYELIVQRLCAGCAFSNRKQEKGRRCPTDDIGNLMCLCDALNPYRNKIYVKKPKEKKPCTSG